MGLRQNPLLGRLRPLAALVALAAALATGFLIVPREASALDPRPAFGVQFHATWADYTDADRTAVLDKLQAAGVKWVRIDLGWASLQEGGAGSYSQWYVDLADRVVNAARARGIHVLATLWATPGWANGGRGTNVPPNDAADYARAATWAAAHFRGRIEAWEVWNEPNLSDFFVGNAAAYAQLLRAAYPAFKSGDSNALVVFGGPSGNDTDFLRNVYAAGIRGAFDVMANHPYQGIADAAPEVPDDGTKYNLSHVRSVHDLMRANGDGAKQIWFTEFGWSSHANPPRVENWNRGVTAEQQADFLVRTIKFVGTTYPYVTNIFWYNERDLASGNAQLDNYGLLDRSLAPKPAYKALKAYLVGGTSSRPSSTSTTVPTTTTAPPPPPMPTPRSRTSPKKSSGQLNAHRSPAHAAVAPARWVLLRP
jgi:polysaccharide biosynthesis protein PslG